MNQVINMFLTSIMFYVIIGLIIGVLVYIRVKLERKKRNTILEYYNLIFSLRNELWKFGSYLDETPNYGKLLVFLDESLLKISRSMDYSEFLRLKKSFSKNIKKYNECIREAIFYNPKIEHIIKSLDIDSEIFY